MSVISDFIYYTLLKKGKIIITILGLIVFIMVFFYIKNWETGFEEVTTNSLKTCSEDNDCFYWCDDCVSVASTEICEAEYKPCICQDGLCQVIA